MESVVSLALPVFAVIAAGALAGRFNFLSISDSQALNRFVFRFAMPAALFALTATTPPPGMGDLSLAASYALAGFTVIFATYFLAQKLFPITKPEAGAHAFTSTLGNAVFLGLPIVLTIEGWARPYVVLMLIEGIFIIAIGAAMMTAKKDEITLQSRIVKLFTDPLKNPLVAAALAGFAFSAFGFSLAGPIESFLSILGRAAGPVALFSLGLFLATHPFPGVGAIAGRISAIAFMKMLVLPAIALGAAYALNITDPAYLGALALFVFVPSGVGSFVMASQYGVYETETAAAVSITTLLSILTISGVLIVFS